MHEPPIEIVAPMLNIPKHVEQLWQDWSRPFQVSIPTVMLIMLIYKLVEESWTWATIGNIVKACYFTFGLLNEI